MKKSIYFILLFSIIIIFIGCTEYEDTIWTGVTYQGTVTNNDDYDGNDYYYDKFYLGCAGTWEISFDSKDNYYMLVTIYNVFGSKVFSKGTEDNFTVTTELIGAPFDVYINIVESNPDWINEGYEADYKVTMTLK